MPLSDFEERFLESLTPSQRQYVQENQAPATYAEALEDDNWVDILWKWSAKELSSVNLEYGRAVEALHDLPGASQEQWDAVRSIFRNYVDNEKVDIPSAARDGLRGLMRPHVDDADFRLSIDLDDRSGPTTDMFDESFADLAKTMHDVYVDFAACVELVHQLDA